MLIIINDILIQIVRSHTGTYRILDLRLLFYRQFSSMPRALAAMDCVAPRHGSVHTSSRLKVSPSIRVDASPTMPGSCRDRSGRRPNDRPYHFLPPNVRWPQDRPRSLVSALGQEIIATAITNAFGQLIIGTSTKKK